MADSRPILCIQQCKMLTRVLFFILSTGRIEFLQAPAMALFSGGGDANRENCRGVKAKRFRPLLCV